MVYTDQNRVEAFLNRPLADSEKVIVDDAIEYMSSFISTYCNREWFPINMEEDEITSQTATARFFDGNGSREMIIDDFIGLVKIKTYDSLGNLMQTIQTRADWLVFPLNKNPKQSIRMKSLSFPYGVGNIEVFAVWGTGKVPADIIMVTTAMVAKFLQKASGSNKVFKKESIEGYSYELMSGSEIDADQEAMLITLSKWKKFIL